MKRGLFVFVGTVILIATATSFAGVCGDGNSDGEVKIIDIDYLINYRN